MGWWACGLEVAVLGRPRPPARPSPHRAPRPAPPPPRTVDPALRSNLIIALGDLALRFPNTLEPYTGAGAAAGARGAPAVAGPHGSTFLASRPPHSRPPSPGPPHPTTPLAEFMYRLLGDPDAAVRKNTLMVLTHLILNDMMKVGAGVRAGLDELLRGPRARWRRPAADCCGLRHAPAPPPPPPPPPCLSPPTLRRPLLPCSSPRPRACPAGEGPHRAHGHVPGGWRCAHRVPGAALLPRAGQEGVQGGGLVGGCGLGRSRGRGWGSILAVATSIPARHPRPPLRLSTCTRTGHVPHLQPAARHPVQPEQGGGPVQGPVPGHHAARALGVAGWGLPSAGQRRRGIGWLAAAWQRRRGNGLPAGCCEERADDRVVMCGDGIPTVPCSLPGAPGCSCWATSRRTSRATA